MVPIVDKRQGVHSKDKGEVRRPWLPSCWWRVNQEPLLLILSSIPFPSRGLANFFFDGIVQLPGRPYIPFSMGFLSTLCFSKELYHQYPLFSWSSSVSSLAPIPDIYPLPVPRPIGYREHIIFKEFETLSTSGSFLSSSSLSFILTFYPLRGFRILSQVVRGLWTWWVSPVFTGLGLRGGLVCLAVEEVRDVWALFSGSIMWPSGTCPECGS